MKSKKNGLLIVLSIIVVLSLSGVLFLYIRFKSLPEYSFEGNLVVRSGVSYEYNPELTMKIINEEIKSNKIIGRFKGDSFLGFKTWVYKIEGSSEKELFAIQGLMSPKEVYVKSK